MTPKRSIYRVAAVTGAAALLFSLAHVRPAAAQASTRYTASCQATSYEAAGSDASCNVSVPYGKVFVVESALFGGFTWGPLTVKMSTKKGNSSFWHYVPPGNLQSLGNDKTYWTAALPGTTFSEGTITLQIHKHYDSYLAWIRVTLSGRLEDE